MTGNVNEWCWDWGDEIVSDTPIWGPDEPGVDNNGITSLRRIARYGSWYTTSVDNYVYRRPIKSNNGYGSYSATMWKDQGFRVVRNW